jgi:HD-like signal output (HDOD) protein
MQRPRAFDPLPRKVRSGLEERIKSPGLELPMLEQVVQEVMQLCNAPDTDAAEMARVLYRDPSMAGNVLKVANSPLYRARAAITSLQDAVARLGMQKVTAISLMVSTRSKVFRSKRYLNLVESMWKQALATACFARELARLLSQDVESSFLCGLFHNIGGPLVLDVIASIEAQSNFQVSPRQAEAAMGEYSMMLGLLLAKEWNLPARVVDAIQYQDSYSDATFKDTAMTVHLARQAAAFMLKNPDASPQTCARKLTELPIIGDLGFGQDQTEAFLGNTERILAIVAALD